MADHVYLTINEFPGTGAPAPTVVDFNFAGGYISPAHVKAELFDPATYLRTPVTVTDEHFVTDYRLSLPISVPSGQVLRVYRDTPKDQPLVNFTNGARIAENNLDLVAEQAVFVAAESADQIAATQVADVLQAVEAAALSAATAKAEAAASATSAALSQAAAQEGASIAGGFALAAGASAEQAGAAATVAATVAQAVRADLASSGDGKGAVMVAFKQSGAGAVERTLQDEAREKFSVKQFGAVGDGLADDTAAFAAATAEIKAISQLGGRTPPALIVPAGIYNIDRILIGHSNFKMVCEPGVMFKWRGGASSLYPYFLYPDNLASSDFADFYKNIEIDGLRIDPATIATGKSVIRLGNMYAGVLKNCHIEDDGFGADTTKLALDIGNGSYKWAIENCTLPRMRCAATSAWNVTTIAFRSVGGRRLQLKNALGITAQGLILEGNETDKISLEEVNGFTNIGGDFEGNGTLYAFVGGGNTNIHSIGNDTTALTGSYTSGTIPTKSSFNDRGFPGFGFPNLNGDAAHMLVRRTSDGRVLRVDSDIYGNLCVDLPASGYVLIGPADDRISRLVSGPAGAPSLSWQENKLGFFSASPIEKPAGVAVTAAGIHAALVALGLISP